MKSRTIKFDCWNGIEIVPVHSLNLYEFCKGEISGYCHKHTLPFGSEDDSQGVISLSEGDGHVFLQHLGINDHNKQPIIEGDVRKFPDGSIGIVVWDESAFAIWSPGSEAVDQIHAHELIKTDKIGNRYANPELIS